MKTFITISFVFLCFGITSAQTQKTTFIIEGMSCQSCANTAIRILEGLEGADSVTVDVESKEAAVYGKSSEEQIKAIIKSKTNFEAVFEGDEILTSLTEAEKEKLDITVIKGGHKIKFKDHLGNGEATVFDFYADWCAPCKVFSPKVEHYIKSNPSVSLRKVDIVDWKSELSVQLTKEFKMPALPFILVFNSKGKLLGKVEGNHINQVEEIVKSSTR